MIGEPGAAVGEIDYSAVSEAVALDVVSHDAIVAMCVYAQVTLAGGAIVYHVGKDAVHVGVAAQAVYHAVGALVVEPRAVNPVVSAGL